MLSLSAVVVGADRVVANGDTANKVGTYQLAIAAKHHGIPFYVAAPSTSCDLSLESGRDIVIEVRPPEELTSINGVPIAAPGNKFTMGCCGGFGKRHKSGFKMIKWQENVNKHFVLKTVSSVEDWGLREMDERGPVPVSALSPKHRTLSVFNWRHVESKCLSKEGARAPNAVSGKGQLLVKSCYLHRSVFVASKVRVSDFCLELHACKVGFYIFFSDYHCRVVSLAFSWLCYTVTVEMVSPVFV